MAILENVIAHFEDCVDYLDRERTRHWVFVRGTVVRAALQLLKAQRARVMTLEEVKSTCRVGERLTEDEKAALEEEGPIYMEFRAEDGYKQHWRNRLDLRDWANGQGFERSYDAIYRCWTSRPTVEQREAAPWA